MTRMLLPGLAVLALAGCAAPATLDPAFGNAIRQNMAVQIVNPDPDYSEDAVSSGPRAAAAIDRYDRGVVKKPPTTSISGTATETGGGDGGSK